MNNFELEQNWVIFEVWECDFRFGNDNIEIPENLNKIKFEYNQWLEARTRNACVLFWNMWCVSDLTWYKFTKEDITEIVNLAEKSYGWYESSWMTMHKWTDCVRNWWNNKFPNEKLITYRLNIWDDKFIEALNKWHSLVVWYKTSREYLIDSQDDWEIQWEDFPKWTWHIVRTNWLYTAIKITDNYFWKKIFNTYKNQKLEKLKENWVFFTSAYLYLKTKSMSEQIKDNIDLENAKKFFDRWITNWTNPREPLTRQEFWATLEVIMERNNLK